MMQEFDKLKDQLIKLSNEFISKYEGKDSKLDDLVKYLKGIEHEFNYYLKNYGNRTK